MCVKVLYVSNKLEDIHNTYRHSPHQTHFPQHLHQGDHGHVHVHHVHVSLRSCSCVFTFMWHNAPSVTLTKAYVTWTHTMVTPESNPNVLCTGA